MKLMIPDEILLKVEKPARYIGNEINMIQKNLDQVDIRFAFCFPDVYEIGMSHLGLQILYNFLNNREDTFCERVFSPWHDLESEMRANNIPLFSLETQQPVKNFDILGFTLQYEMSYTNILNILDLSNIPIYSEDRTEEDPIVCAGGPCAYNPEVLAEFIDFFYIGEGEVKYNEILDIYKQNKVNGGSRNDFLIGLLEVEGIYVPKFYDVTYKEDGEIESFEPNHPSAKKTITKVIVDDLSDVYYPTKPLVPLIQPIHERAVLELFRGCIRGCRFCQAGMVYRPVRERSSEKLISQAKEVLDNTGFDEISLISLSTSDYKELDKVVNYINTNHKGVNISLPSLRIDDFSLELMNSLSTGKKSSLTFAPEAGSQRLRDVINKGISEKEILKGASLAFNGGWNRVKLYFMLGLPTETYEDVEGIQTLSYQILDKYFGVEKEKRAKNIKITVSTSFFVPKAFTPFQWEPQNSYEEFMEKQKHLSSLMNKRQIQYNCHDAKLSSLEGALARGDRRLCKVIYKAWEKGCKFDGWSEFFDYNKWMSAFDECEVDIKFYNNRRRSYEEILPWDHISTGVTKEFLIKEHKKALAEDITVNCRKGCAACGANLFGEGVCYEKKN